MEHPVHSTIHLNTKLELQSITRSGVGPTNSSPPPQAGAPDPRGEQGTRDILRAALHREVAALAGLPHLLLRYYKVDLRTITLGVPPQEVGTFGNPKPHKSSVFPISSTSSQVLTRDSVTVSVDAVVYYRVCNATLSKTAVENAHHSTSLLSQTILTNILGTKNLHEILSDREVIAVGMRRMLDKCTEPWGIKVERVEIKDARLPIQLQVGLAQGIAVTQ